MSHRVELVPSGITFEVEARESILDAALRNGISLPYGCRGGHCGACVTRLVEGTVGYPDTVPEALADSKPGSHECAPCLARPEGPLRLAAEPLDTVADIPVRTLPARVERMERLAPDVMALYLKLPEAERLKFLAGQYIEVLTKNGEARAFSLANAPDNDATLELHVRHVAGGDFSERVFSTMKEKTVLRLRGPKGSFVPRENDRPMVFMAGGTGFAPIKALVEYFLSKQERREMWIYWGARTRADLYMTKLPEGWSAAHASVHYVPVLSGPGIDPAWDGRTGFVHEAIATDFPDMSGLDVYAGGPPVMVHTGREAFIERGLAVEHFYSDAFEYAHQARKP
ncbi:MAG: CDP-6-deoxy-delta-3,4-glucoseen reductase [Gammaproteobacteria bacterium]|nr:CDP-6-deoxy-delta-3,4-glucoseen reductase [Gammaproteobacteria bacterium]